MDEIYLDYDPRNARFGLVPMPQPGRSFAPGFTGALFPQRPPIAPRFPLGAPQPVYYPQPQPAYYPQPIAAPAPESKLRRKLGDLTVGDVVPLLAQVLVAIRPMPAAPGDQGRVELNVTNQTKFVDAIARHFHLDQQLVATGAVLSKLLA